MMRRWLGRLRGLFPDRRPWWVPDLLDLHIYGGTLLASAGLWLLRPAFGLIGLGLVLFSLGFLLRGRGA